MVRRGRSGSAGGKATSRRAAARRRLRATKAAAAYDEETWNDSEPEEAVRRRQREPRPRRRSRSSTRSGARTRRSRTRSRSRGASDTIARSRRTVRKARRKATAQRGGLKSAKASARPRRVRKRSHQRQRHRGATETRKRSPAMALGYTLGYESQESDWLHSEGIEYGDDSFYSSDGPLLSGASPRSGSSSPRLLDSTNDEDFDSGETARDMESGPTSMRQLYRRFMAKAPQPPPLEAPVRTKTVAEETQERAKSIETAKTIERLRKGQLESTAVAHAAAQEAAQLRDHIARLEKQMHALRVKLAEADHENQSLAMSRGRDKLEVKELKYRNMYLVRELKQVKETATKEAASHRAKLNGMASSMNSLEDVVATRARGVQREVRHMKGLLTTLQRHVSQHMGSGYLASGQRVMTALWQSVENMLAVGSPGGTSIQSRVSSRRDEELRHSTHARSRRASSSDDGNSADPDRDLALSLDTIVADLERENQRLRAEIEVVRTELAQALNQADSARVIPKYKQAVKQARGHAETLRKRLREEVKARQQLEILLGRAQAQAKTAFVRTTQHAQSLAEADRAIADTAGENTRLVQHLNESQSQQRAVYHELATAAEDQQEVISELQNVVESQRYQMEALGSRPAHIEVNIPAAPQADFMPPPPLPPLEPDATTASSSAIDALLDTSSEDDSFGTSFQGATDHASTVAAGATAAVAATKVSVSGPPPATNALNELQGDLLKLDEEIAVLQQGIADATRMQSPPPE